jgi:hypothetical protein
MHGRRYNPLAFRTILLQESTMAAFRSTVLTLAAALAFVYGVPRAALSAPPDPCSLLAQAEVSAALGVSVDAGKPTGKICRWAGPRGRAGQSPAVVLTLQDAKAFDFAKSPSKSPTLSKTPAAGVGDDAVFNTVGTVTATLTVKKGDTYFEVHVYGFPVDQTKTMEATLGKEVVANLK